MFEAGGGIVNIKTVIFIIVYIILDRLIHKKYPQFYKRAQFPANILFSIFAVIYCGFLLYALYDVLNSSVSIGDKVFFVIFIGINILVFIVILIKTWVDWHKEGIQLDKEFMRICLITGFVILGILIYTRPLSFEEIMPGFYDAPVTKCEAIYRQQEVGENGNPRYTTLVKEFEIGSEDYEELMKMLTDNEYKRQLATLFVGGKRNTYSIPFPYSRIVFYQDNKEYEFSLFNKYLPAGTGHDKSDYTPQGRKKFYNEVTEYIKTHGVTINEEVKQY